MLVTLVERWPSLGASVSAIRRPLCSVKHRTSRGAWTHATFSALGRSRSSSSWYLPSKRITDADSPRMQEIPDEAPSLASERVFLAVVVTESAPLAWSVPWAWKDSTNNLNQAIIYSEERNVEAANLIVLEELKRHGDNGWYKSLLPTQQRL